MRTVWVLSLVVISVLGCGDDDAQSSMATCGNMVIEMGEVCEVNNLNGATCATLGLPAGGILMCNPMTCGYDTTMCTATLPPIAGTGG